MKEIIATGLALVLAAAATSAGATTKLVTGFEGKVLTTDSTEATGYDNFAYGADKTAAYSGGRTVTIPGVTFTGMSGVQGNGSGWNFPNAPEGTHTAFLQSYGEEPKGQFTIDLTTLNLNSGQSYTINFEDMTRPGYSPGSFMVAYGTSTMSYGGAVGAFKTDTFTFKADGGNTLTFSALQGDGSDTSVGIDNVAFVPEPATWAMMLIGFGGLGAALRTNWRRVALVRA
jgi:hypothetical protein